MKHENIMKMQYKTIGIALALGLMVGAPVFAEDSMTMTTTSNTTTTADNQSGDKKGMKSDMEAKHEEVKAKLKEKQTELQTAIDAKKAAMQDAKTEMKTNMDAAKAQMKAAIAAKQAAFKAEVVKIKQQKLSTRKDFAVQRFTAAANLIETNQGRVAHLITERKTQGKDTAAAEVSLQDSKDKLVVARASIAALAALPAATDADGKALKTASQKAESDLKASRDALLKALDSLEVKVQTNTMVETNGTTTTMTTGATVSAQ